jgi:hypothetical protein
MRENEFEKQVQKQLEDFQLNPSASVWENVEDQIRKKKRRRVVFYILLPAALVLLGYLTNYFLFTGSNTESNSPEVTKDRMTQQPVPAKNERLLTTDKTNTASQEKEKSIITQPQEINKTNGSAKKEIPQNQKTSSVVKNNRPPVSKDLLIIEVKERSAIKHNDNVNLKKESDDSPPINNDPAKQDVVTIINKPITEADKKTAIDQNATEETKTQKDIVIAEKDPVITITDSVKIEIPGDNKNEAIATKPVRRGGKTAKFKINWGIDLSAGVTSNNTSIFSLDKSYAADRVYNNPGNATGGGSPILVNPPSSISLGSAFRLGVAGELQISKKSRFSTGLQYSYTSNRIKTGAKKDTTIQLQIANNFSSQVDAIYRGTQQNNYTNSYHFIQIPVWYHWQINKGEKLPIQWNVGASVGYMFATNGLIYTSGYSGIYYRDKNAFTRTHFNLGTGLSFRLKSKNRMEWVIGPELSFDMSPLMKNNNRQYLLYGGINTKLFFLKKKNK